MIVKLVDLHPTLSAYKANLKAISFLLGKGRKVPILCRTVKKYVLSVLRKTLFYSCEEVLNRQNVFT